MGNLLPIGRFSRVTLLSVKQLRHYDEVGLLQPAVVDGMSGYRYYEVDQATDALLIRQLRAVDMPLAEIGRLLAERDPAARRRLLAAHRVRLEEALTRQQEVLAFLDRLLTQEAPLMDYHVTVRDLDEQPFAAVLAHTTQAGIPDACAQHFPAVAEHLARQGVAPAGPVFIRYLDPEFNPDSVNARFGLPTAQEVPGGDGIESGSLPKGEAAVVVHSGSYDTIPLAYQALSAWMAEQGREAAGPPWESYVAAPPAVSDPDDYRTEVIWPLA